MSIAERSPVEVRRPIEICIYETNKAIEILQSRLEDLRERLTPILIDVSTPEEEDVKESIEPSRSSMEYALIAHKEHIMKVTTQIDSIYEGLRI